VWGRKVSGLTLTFHLAGINNQNFLMRDEETGTYWQQISGRAISGPLAGHTLPFVASEELTFALWKAEQPQGTVLKDVAAYVAKYSPKDWDLRMSKVPTVLSYAQPGLAPRDLMLGIRAFGASRAFPYSAVAEAKLVQDHLGNEPIALVLGPDQQSVRAFLARISGVSGAVDFYRTHEDRGTGMQGAGDPLMIDSATGSRWNFQGCAVKGPLKGSCLERVEVIKDYWFDWRNYNPDTTVYGKTVR
jgi:Protein of unknown function (DUF3179)